MDWTAIALGVLAMFGAGGVGAAFFDWLKTRRKSQAEAEKTEAEEAQTYAAVGAAQNSEWERLYQKQTARVEKLEIIQASNIGRINELVRRISELEGKNVEWERNSEKMQAQLTALQVERQEWKIGIYKLITQLTEMEIKPAWKPKDTGPFKS